MTYNTAGIILRYRDVGEYDRIYSVLTCDHGKVDAWAQGVRKPQSKLVAHLQPLYFCDFMFARGRRFDRVAQVRVQNRWAEIWGDLEKMGQAMYGASLTDMVLRPGTREGKVFELMHDMLQLLNRHPERLPAQAGSEGSPTNVGNADKLRDSSLPAVAQNDSLVCLFSLKLLKESGFAPELRNCVLCKAVAEGLTRHFDAIRGGVLCDECFRKAGSEAFPASSLTLETLETVLGAPLSALEMPEAVARELKIIAEAMIAAHFEEEPRSRAFVNFFAKEPLYAGVTM